MSNRLLEVLDVGKRLKMMGRNNEQTGQVRGIAPIGRNWLAPGRVLILKGASYKRPHALRRQKNPKPQPRPSALRSHDPIPYIYFNISPNAKFIPLLQLSCE